MESTTTARTETKTGTDAAGAGIGATGPKSEATVNAAEASAVRIAQPFARFADALCMGHMPPASCGQPQSSAAAIQADAAPPAWHSSQTATSGPSTLRSRDMNRF